MPSWGPENYCATRSPHTTRAVGVGAVAFLMKSDLRHSSAMLRRNLKHVRSWLEEQGAGAAAE